MSTSARKAIPYPAPNDVDAAPQLLVIALADAGLSAVERALDSAHPILAATQRRDGEHPLLLTSERLAVQVLHATTQLAALLRDYTYSVRFDIEDLDDDSLDPF
jgi:hypothetical protein